MIGGSGRNINGPSLIRIPEWLPRPLGRYYLYFAHHQGKYIRLAYADQLEGPWQILSGGSLRLDQTACKRHVASPDLHVDHGQKRLIMYFHGETDSGQRSFAAVSKDGINFVARPGDLGPFYFRVFRNKGFVFALSKTDPDCMLLRATQWFGPFEEGPHLLSRVRHTALFCENNILTVFCSRIGDAPEVILQTRISLSADWRHWREGDYDKVLSSKKDYEGALLPISPSYDRHPQVCVVRYEYLVLDYGKTIQRICDFLEEPCVSKILNWHTYATLRNHPAWEGEVKPLYASSINRWQDSEHEEHISQFMTKPRVKTLLRHYGYLE